jgi:hypothetical protein
LAFVKLEAARALKFDDLLEALKHQQELEPQLAAVAAVLPELDYFDFGFVSPSTALILLYLHFCNVPTIVSYFPRKA